MQRATTSVGFYPTPATPSTISWAWMTSQICAARRVKETQEKIHKKRKALKKKNQWDVAKMTGYNTMKGQGLITAIINSDERTLKTARSMIGDPRSHAEKL
jgi:hypothetical protein